MMWRQSQWRWFAPPYVSTYLRRGLVVLLVVLLSGFGCRAQEERPYGRMGAAMRRSPMRKPMPLHRPVVQGVDQAVGRGKSDISPSPLRRQR
jgi:hypothetical protein